MCELAANGKDSEWGRGGLATCVCNANEHGPPQLFLHCCAYELINQTTHCCLSPLQCRLQFPAADVQLMGRESKRVEMAYAHHRKTHDRLIAIV